MTKPNTARTAAIECFLKRATEELGQLKSQADAFQEIKAMFDTGLVVLAPETPLDVCQRLDQLLEEK